LRQIGAYDLKTLASLDDVRALKNALVARAEHGVFILEDGECSVLSGADFNEIESYIQLGEEIQKITALKGTVASKGKARGTVSLCLTLDDIESFKEGDILVTSMTRPEFMPAMKKAAAFVTDEGGITCHAAIVSRELKKPCIIGTKNATQVLRSGDIVEVDAEKGMVHIISRVIRPSHALETTHV
jgi:pyruvate,water dikinase